MKKVKIKYTKRNTYVFFNDSYYRKDKDNNLIPVTDEKYTGIRDKYGWCEFSGNFDSPEEALKEFDTLQAAKEAEEKKIRMQKAANYEAILADSENFSAQEIWEAVCWAINQDWGWRAADIVLKDNPLSKKLLEKLGSFTVTPFDDKTLLIKAGNQRYGNHRKWKSIDDLIN